MSKPARIGILTPHSDPVPEAEFRAMAPDGVTTHVARVPLGTVGNDGRIVSQFDLDTACRFAEPPHIDAAAEFLATLPVHVIAFAFTSSSYLRGPEGDGELRARLEATTRPIQVAISAPAACRALHAIRARRIALSILRGT
jgi:maleate isomerase